MDFLGPEPEDPPVKKPFLEPELPDQPEPPNQDQAHRAETHEESPDELVVEQAREDHEPRIRKRWERASAALPSKVQVPPPPQDSWNCADLEASLTSSHQQPAASDDGPLPDGPLPVRPLPDGPLPDGPLPDVLLDALQKRHSLKEEMGLKGDLDEEQEEELDEADPKGAKTFVMVTERLKKMMPMQVSKTADDLTNVLGQLRAWYCTGVGFILLTLLERAAGPQVLPGSPGLSLVRILEGVVLICTVHHEPVRTVEVLELLLRKRRLPPTTFCRLEAALVALSPPDKVWAGVPPMLSLAESACDKWLRDKAYSLRPDTKSSEKMEKAKKALEQVVSIVFPGCRADYFGSAVNGFETQASDLDCVLQLEEAENAADVLELDAGGVNGSAASTTDNNRRKKVSAAKAARYLAKRIQDGLAEDFGIVVYEVVSTARVPILKCRSAEGVDIDVSFNNTLPLHNSRLLRAYAEFDTRAQDLGRLVKCWAKKRHVNDALEGTLSSYSHTLLVVHYLQHLGLLPNLQDKTAVAAEELQRCGEVALDDGKHDVWFLDPERVGDEKPWCLFAPVNCTLYGLLSGFMRYYAYEVAAHSEVISIRLPRGRVPKMAYFRASVPVRETAEEEDAHAAPEEEALDHDVQGSDGPDTDAGAAADDEDDEEVLLPSSKENGDAAPTLERPVPKAVAAKSWALSAEEADLQRHVSRRQVLSIDDPFERGRCLGASFQGMERLSMEYRYACSLLNEEPSEEKLRRLFEGAQPPKSLWKLMEQVRLPSVWEARIEPFKKNIIIPQEEVGRLIGRGGSQINQYKQTPGISGIWIDDDRRNGPATVHLTGTKRAVEDCAEQISQLLEQQAPQSYYSSSASSARVPGSTRTPFAGIAASLPKGSGKKGSGKEAVGSNSHTSNGSSGKGWGSRGAPSWSWSNMSTSKGGMFTSKGGGRGSDTKGGIAKGAVGGKPYARQLGSSYVWQ